MCHKIIELYLKSWKARLHRIQNSHSVGECNLDCREKKRGQLVESKIFVKIRLFHSFLNEKKRNPGVVEMNLGAGNVGMCGLGLFGRLEEAGCVFGNSHNSRSLIPFIC